MRAGTVDPGEVIELHEVVSGKSPDRVGADECTLDKSIGTGFQDVAVAYCAYRRALARGLRRTVEDFQSIKIVEPN